MATVVQPVGAHFRNRPARGTVARVAGLATTTHGADEAALAQRAAAGDGDAFATLYERYESRVLNLCFRILGSQDDAADAAQEAFVNVLRRLPKLEGRELAFGSYVFTSARNACYDLIERRRRTEPSDEIPEHATPVGGGVGGGGMGFDPGDPEDDPERNVLLEARTGEIREANLTLPERQREALALKELEGLSYDEIAEIMGMNRNSVAQLISRARIGLRDALRGTALASIAASSPDCDRAAPLLSALGDGQLCDDSPEAEWLGDHLVRCDSCPLRRDAMQEAGVSYRAWLPITAGPLLFRETMAEAAELVGADWSEVIARREGARSAAGPAAAAGAGGAGTEGARAAVLRHRRLDLVLMALLGLALVLVVFVGPTGDSSVIDAIEPAADEEPLPAEDEGAESGKKAEQPGKSKEKKHETAEGPSGSPTALPAAGEQQAGSGEGRSGADSQTSAETGTGQRERRSSSGGNVDRNEGGGGREDVAGDPAPEPPPAEPTPDQPLPSSPPTETTPPTSAPGCRSASDAPIPCGTQPPRTPPTRTPTGTPPTGVS
jgi:RNA polymerase sigma factor (sigma-70 family)